MKVDGKKLRRARRKKGMTQDQLAKRLNYAGGATVSYWETETIQPPRHVINRLAHILDVMPRELRKNGGRND